MIHLTADDEAGMDAEAKRWLENRGYAVAEWNPSWETPSEFCERLGVSVMTLHRRLKRRDGPPVELDRPNGQRRLIRLCSNVLFDRFVKGAQ
jgi:hypothetical protein